MDADDREVQIKMNAGKSVSLYATCDRLVVLKVVSPEEAEIVYDGPGAPVWEIAEAMQKSGERSIRLMKLRAIATDLNAREEYQGANERAAKILSCADSTGMQHG